MTSKRSIKQIIYGACYLGLFLLIIFLIYLIWLKPAPTCFDNKQNQGETGIDCGGPCPSCEIKTLVSPEASWVKYFPSETQTIVAAEVKNPNLNWGADAFSYTFDIYGGNTKLKSFTKDSFIYGGEVKYFVEVFEIDFKKITNVKISFSDINWKPNTKFSKPVVQIREIKTEPVSQEVPGVIVSGFIANNNAFPLSKVKIIGFLSNTGGLQIGASKTELENILAFEEKFFKLNFPKNLFVITSPIQQSTSSISSVAYEFNRDLTIGSQGEDVKELQEFLKEEGFFSRGITDYFGSVTRNSLIQFQKEAGISPASGYFGPKTRNYINSLESAPDAPAPSTPNLSLTGADPSKTKVYAEALR
jgi:hypothetical protein